GPAPPPRPGRRRGRRAGGGDVRASRRAAQAVVAAAVLFSTGGAAIKATDLSGLQVACLRSGVAAVALLAMLPGTRRRWSWRVVLVGAAFAVTLILFVQANKLTTAANSIFLQSTSPLYLVLLGPLLLREPVRRGDLAFMAVLGAGMSLFFVASEAPGDTATNPAAGNAMALASGVGWALTVAGLRWLARSDEPDAAARATVAGNAIAFVACLPAVAASPAVGVRDAMVVTYLGVVQIGLAYVFLTAAVRRVGALEASLLLFVEPALSPVWAWLVTGETPSPLALTGGAIIIGATLVRTVRHTRGHPRPRPAAPARE
ncbi:MAG: DMT family transporter, partial [Actinomycetota bacterium]